MTMVLERMVVASLIVIAGCCCDDRAKTMPRPSVAKPEPTPKEDPPSTQGGSLLRCCDGTTSGCSCSGNHKGCCSHHKGICGCI